MSKGTKQIRLGRVIRLIDQMQLILKSMQETNERFPTAYTLGRAEQLERDIKILKSEFQID